MRGNYRNAIVRTDGFIRKRKLSSQEVARNNYVLKARARRYIAAGREGMALSGNSVIRALGGASDHSLPPKDELWRFGGEIFAKFEDGHVYYTDEFGRTEHARDFLKDDADIATQHHAVDTIGDVLELEPGRNWVRVRRDLTDEQIGMVCSLYEGFWPLETDLLQLLPKPNGNARAISSAPFIPRPSGTLRSERRFTLRNRSSSIRFSRRDGQEGN